MTALNPRKVGVIVQCVACGRIKKPVGRSVGVVAASSYCDRECVGWNKKPYPGSLWPGESEEQFGYLVGDAGTRIEGES